MKKIWKANKIISWRAQTNSIIAKLFPFHSTFKISKIVHEFFQMQIFRFDIWK